MSRAIKFRIWDVVSNKFVYDIDGLFKNVSVIPSKIFSGEDKLLIAQQWTGLVDSLGKEIYEGDIVKYQDQSNVYRISSYAGGFRVTGLHSKKGVLIGAFKEDGGRVTGLEMVGNIFENPDLLAN